MNMIVFFFFDFFEVCTLRYVPYNIQHTTRSPTVAAGLQLWR